MGSAVGEKFVQGVKVAMKEKHLYMFCNQWWSKNAGIDDFSYANGKDFRGNSKIQKMNLPYISVMVDPIFGGVSASLAMLGDINMLV